MKIARGQVWSVLDNAGANCQKRTRLEVRIVRIIGSNVVLETMGDAPRRLTWKKSILLAGRRGAHIVSEGEAWRDKTILQERVSSLRCLTAEERRTASDLRRTEGPRGIASVADSVAETVRLQRQGLTYAQIAKQMGCSTHTVSQRLTRAREARQDALALKAIGQ